MKASLNHQTGAALIVSLLLLLVMTLLGVSAMQGSVLEEKMAGNFFEREKTFQIAEAQLRSAEAVVRAMDIDLNIPANGCTNGICAEPDLQARTPRYRDSSYSAWSEWSPSPLNAAYESRYLIEYLGKPAGIHSLRVSVAAQRKGQPGALVVLQSVVRRP